MIIKSFEAKALKNRSVTIKIADIITQFAGSVSFFVLNIIIFISWIVINLGLIPGVTPFDPFPFVLLTTTVSLEAIILAIFVLMSQNRQSLVTSLRDEIQLQVNLISEREVTKILKVLDEHLKTKKISEQDSELANMVKQTDVSYIERELEKQLSRQELNLLSPQEIAKVITDTLTTSSKAR